MRAHPKYFLLAAIGVALPAAAHAHSNIGATVGFTHGFGHPVHGLDHMIAMVTVGLLASRLGGRAIWQVPPIFVMLMAAGGSLGVAGIAVPYVETAIAISVVVLGAIVALDVKLPMAAAMGIVGLFAVFHGHAHGAEMPASAGGTAYAAGFLLATALLHILGISLGSAIAYIAGIRGRSVVQAVGGSVAVAGVSILNGII